VPSIRVIHLVWAPLGPGMLDGFLAALREHPPGRDHALSVVLNGFAARADAGAELALLDGLGADVVFTPEPVQDLAAYAHAARQATEPQVCLMNSYARPLRGGWLELLAAAIADRPLAAAAATGSWESHATELRLREHLAAAASLRDRLGAPLDWLAYRRRFPPFPNPHLRTNGLLYPRELLLDVLARPPRSKPEAFALESGRRGLSRRIADGGGDLLVVARDGRALGPQEWAAGRIFRAGEQENLLIADNRTEDWRLAGPAERARLAARAWGRSGDGR
jgi:hypothetical protein